jgi:uncharacterized protein YkwD
MRLPLTGLVVALSAIVTLSSFHVPGNYVSAVSNGFATPPGSFIRMEKDIFRYVNKHREAVGLPVLSLNDIESEVATRHSFNMANGKLPFGHKDLQKRMHIISTRVGHIVATGENVASGQMSAQEVVEGWLRSPGHRRNIEGDFTLTGIGIAQNRKGVIYYTQIFTK